MSQEEVEKRKISTFVTRFSDKFRKKKKESESEKIENQSELDLKKKLDQISLDTEVIGNQIKEEIKDDLVDLNYYSKIQTNKDEYDEFEPKHIAHINSAQYIPNENNL